MNIPILSIDAICIAHLFYLQSPELQVELSDPVQQLFCDLPSISALDKPIRRGTASFSRRS